MVMILFNSITSWAAPWGAVVGGSRAETARRRVVRAYFDELPACRRLVTRPRVRGSGGVGLPRRRGRAAPGPTRAVRLRCGRARRPSCPPTRSARAPSRTCRRGVVPVWPGAGCRLPGGPGPDAGPPPDAGAAGLPGRRPTAGAAPACPGVAACRRCPSRRWPGAVPGRRRCRAVRPRRRESRAARRRIAASPGAAAALRRVAAARRRAGALDAGRARRASARRPSPTGFGSVDQRRRRRRRRPRPRPRRRASAPLTRRRARRAPPPARSRTPAAAARAGRAAAGGTAAEQPASIAAAAARQRRAERLEVGCGAGRSTASKPLAAVAAAPGGRGTCVRAAAARRGPRAPAGPRSHSISRPSSRSRRADSGLVDRLPRAAVACTRAPRDLVVGEAVELAHHDRRPLPLRQLRARSATSCRSRSRIASSLVGGPRRRVPANPRCSARVDGARAAARSTRCGRPGRAMAAARSPAPRRAATAARPPSSPAARPRRLRGRGGSPGSSGRAPGGGACRSARTRGARRAARRSGAAALRRQSARLGSPARAWIAVSSARAIDRRIIRVLRAGSRHRLPTAVACHAFFVLP